MDQLGFAPRYVGKNYAEHSAVPRITAACNGLVGEWTHWVGTAGPVFSLACRNRNLGSFRSGGEHCFDFGLERH